MRAARMGEDGLKGSHKRRWKEKMITRWKLRTIGHHKEGAFMRTTGLRGLAGFGWLNGLCALSLTSRRRKPATG